MMTPEFKAGFFVLLAVAALVFMTTRLTQNRFSFAGTKTYYVEIHDATGLLSKTKIKMAGLDIGQITGIELVGRQARVTLDIGSQIVIHKDAFITVKSIGFLGDKYLELYAGSDSSPVLPEGSVIPENLSGGGFEQLAEKTTEVLKDLKDITQTLKDSLRGETENGEVSEDTRLDRILDNMEEFTAGLASLDKLGELTDRFTEVASNIRDITDKVKRGEGTVGKLISDSETIDKLNSTLSGVNKFITRAEKLSVKIDAKSGALANTGSTKNYFSLMLQPTYDKYYLAGVVTGGPRGLVSEVKTDTTTNPSSGSSATATKIETETEDTAVRFNLQFAKRFSDTLVRFGLFETTGGVALDQYLLNDKVKLVSEVYRFKKYQNPQVNIGSEVHLYQPFYLWLGGDDLLNKLTRNIFIGAGIRFSDEDLKGLLATAASAR